MKVDISLLPGFEALYDSYVSTEVGQKLLGVDGIAPWQLDMGTCSHDFFDKKLQDISTDASVNFAENVSPSSYRTHISNGMMKLLGYHLLWYKSAKRYGEEFANHALSMIWDGDLYFHDTHGVKIQMPYCYAFSLTNLVFEGRPYGSSPNSPPQHRKAFLSQVDKLIGDLSKQFAGAVAPSDFFLWYAYFCRKDLLNTCVDEHRDAIINDMQGMVCLLNDESRAEGDPPFTNIALYDMVGLENLFGHIIYPDGTKPDIKYIYDLQMIFAKWFSKGDPISGFPYKFPVVTMNLTTDKFGNFVDDHTAWRCATINRNMGNFNIHYGDKSKVAMCCRYENDLEDMGITPDSFGNGGVNIGSHRVIDPNIPRAAIIANGNVDAFYTILDEYFDVAAKLLIVHRYDILQHRIDKNPEYLKFFGKLKWFSLNHMFSTFGIFGIHEATEFMGYDILSEEGTEFAQNLMQYMSDKNKQFRKHYGVAFNIEEIPGEQACVAILNKDKILFPYHKQLAKYDLYSNQYIPLTTAVDIPTRLELSGRFMQMIKGGGIVHINVESQIDSVEKMYGLMKLAAKSGVTHMAICHRFGRCENGHSNIVGQNNVCPICGKQIIRARARIIGYFSDEFAWNIVRREKDAPNRYYSELDGDLDE